MASINLDDAALLPKAINMALAKGFKCGYSVVSGEEKDGVKKEKDFFVGWVEINSEEKIGFKGIVDPRHLPVEVEKSEMPDTEGWNNTQGLVSLTKAPFLSQAPSQDPSQV